MRPCTVGVVSWILNLALIASCIAGGDSWLEGDPISVESLDGERFELQKTNDGRVTVVCFLGTECPLARLYGPRLQQLSDQLSGDRVRFVGVFSNHHDAPDEILKFATEHEIQFPLIKDVENRIADLYGAKRTPEVFVVDAELSIRYRGRVDDQYLPGVARPAPERSDLQQALAELLADREVSVPRTDPVGCLIGRVKLVREDATVTYSNQVSRILNRHCVECHRSGEIGPFALTDYDEVMGWSDMMLEVVQQGRMPPWHANPEHGTFSNARGVSAEEVRQLAQWVADGAPLGDRSQLPDPPQFVSGWRLPREPDRIIEMRNRPFVVPADGTVEYQYFVVDPGFDRDRWVTAAQVIPGNAAVVHHSIVFIRPPDGARFRGVGWLGAYVPGQRPFVLPKGRARFVPAGSKLVFQQHYTPNGKTQEDVTRVGLLFGEPDDVTHEVLTLVGLDQEFEIPARTAAYSVEGEFPWFPADGELLAIMPHMHLRGKSFRLLRQLQGRDDLILDVPHYDFNWQHVYQLREPMKLSEVDALKFSVVFDNSSENPFNPDPDQRVTWGDQTWEEMAVAFVEVSEPRTSRPQMPNDEPMSVAEQRAVERLLNEFFERFDENQDGIVERLETPLSFRSFGFRRYDLNGDERLTPDEVREPISKDYLD